MWDVQGLSARGTAAFPDHKVIAVRKLGTTETGLVKAVSHVRKQQNPTILLTRPQAPVCLTIKDQEHLPQEGEIDIALFYKRSGHKQKKKVLTKAQLWQYMNWAHTDNLYSDHKYVKSYFTCTLYFTHFVLMFQHVNTWDCTFSLISVTIKSIYFINKQDSIWSISDSLVFICLEGALCYNL